jgi:hypothetical protein
MIPLFTLRLLFGMSLTWCLAPVAQITSGFFRIQMLVALGLSVLSWLTAGQLFSGEEGIAVVPPWFSLLLILAAGISFLGSVLWTLERRVGGFRCALLLNLLSALLVAVTAVRLPEGGWQAVQQLGTALSSGWLIGGTTTAMLLGHWYLTATGMSLQPLIRLNQLFAAAATVRLLFSLWALTGVNWSLLDATSSAWLLLRWAGIFGPLITAGLVVRILRYRNTQSATGVLYAATILVFMGEMAATLLKTSPAFSWSP